MSAVDLERLAGLLERATPGPWMVQDGCSWRRIGTHMHDGDVLRPTNQRDGHPDFAADDGKMHANLSLIVAAVNALPSLLSEIERLSGTPSATNSPQRERRWHT